MKTRDVKLSELCLKLVKKINKKQRIHNDIKKDLVIIFTTASSIDKSYITLFENIEDAGYFCDRYKDFNVAERDLMSESKKNLFRKIKKHKKDLTMVLTVERFSKTKNENKQQIHGFLTSFNSKKRAKKFCIRNSSPFWIKDRIISCIVKKNQIENLHLYFKQ